MKPECSLFLFAFAVLGIVAFGLCVVFLRRVHIAPGVVLTGWRAVVVGLAVAVLGPVLLVALVGVTAAVIR